MENAGGGMFKMLSLNNVLNINLKRVICFKKYNKLRND